MQGLIIRTRAYHGDPVIVNGLPTRAGYVYECPIPTGEVVHVPFTQEPGDFPLLKLVEDFEAFHRCKVNYSDPRFIDGLTVYEFDVFEPSWGNDRAAKHMVDELSWRLCDWVRGSFV